MGLLDACPNQNMLEVEIYSRFYDGMDAKNKDLVNSSSGGSFSRLRVSEAKIVMERLLWVKRGYVDTSVTLPQSNEKNTPAESNDDQLESRVDKLERALQSVIQTSHSQVPSLKTHPQTDQVSHRQHTDEIWNSNRSWNPGVQADVCQQEYPQYGGRESSRAPPQWSRTEEYPTFPHHPEPHPTATQFSTWQMGYQGHQPYPDSQGYEPSLPVYQSNYPSHYPSFQNQPHQPWHSDAEDHLPTWASEDWQPRNPQPHQGQFYLIQDQYHSHPQQNFEPPMDGNWQVSSIEERVKGLIVSQQSMRRCSKSNDELAQGMQNTYDAQKASMDEMKQVSLLADIMKGIQEDRARSRVDEQREDKESVSDPEERRPLMTERESEIPLERQEEVEFVKKTQAEKESLAEEKSITTHFEGETAQEAPEEAKDEPQDTEEEVIKPCVGLGATLFYLQAGTVHGLDEKVKRLEATAGGESTQKGDRLQ